MPSNYINLLFFLYRLACNPVWIPRSELSKSQTHAQQMCWRKKQLTCREYVQVNLPIHSTFIICRLFLTSVKFIYSQKATKFSKITAYIWHYFISQRQWKVHKSEGIFVAFSEYLTFTDKNIKGRLMQLSISARELQYQYDLRSKIN